MKASTLVIVLCAILISACDSGSNHDLRNMPEEADPKLIGDKLVELFLNTPNSQYGNPRPENAPTQITYPDVCTWLGALWFAQSTKNENFTKRLEERFIPLMTVDSTLQPPKNHVDNNVFGAVPLELYLQTEKTNYLDTGLDYADTQWEAPEDATEEELTWADKGYSWQTRIWIDDMFMITAIQAQAYRATDNRKYIDRAAAEMVMYLDEIQQPNGLFYHSPDTKFFWGRGNGWMAVGMAELLRILPDDNPNRSRILEAYLKMMETLKELQGEDGMWHQLLDDPDAWNETSGSAMFTYSMIIGVKNGWLDEKEYAEVARKAWLTLVTYINENNEVTEVCEGTNIKDDRQYYLDRKRIVGDLHGQAPMIWCAHALTDW
ncbi:glycoside hydrolase family 88 protein [Olivibacter sp. SDN3]|uniref:glycoside hydrolase family 88/105 protein n=1 Tax=Olivibacter sp. SDN3 TaxID=2764720 RepID=UPI0016512662|nr:glycoside hydrolase family 88 protein [Olivibacter sp. SDN3]QNL48012.1 glycoside hydrolase family 88 protein [Olivibacter sp. SDN3]